MVESDNNNNKYYQMQEDGDSINVEYGRIGSSSQKATFPISKWNSKYREKVKKGYVDQTDLFAVAVDSTKEKYAKIEDAVVRDIVDRLQRMAKKAISENYTISSASVTQAMIDEATNKLLLLSSTEDVKEFNEHLLELFKIIPRKMRKVADNLIKDKGEIEKVLEKEQDLLDVMKGQVVQNSLDQNDDIQSSKTILDIMGISIEKNTLEDIEIIKKALNESKEKYVNSWKVVNHKTQERYNKFLQENTIKNTKLLFHGSKNENWWNIINTGLLLRPNASITGKMFGYGIYFAPKAQKSIGYTSLSGSYWANGNSKTAFMSLYEVAYGTPYDVHSFNNNYNTFNYEKLQSAMKGANCLHAHSGSMLRNDEIIVYKEEQITIKYLVEIK